MAEILFFIRCVSVCSRQVNNSSKMLKATSTFLGTVRTWPLKNFLIRGHCQGHSRLGQVSYARLGWVPKGLGRVAKGKSSGLLQQIFAQVTCPSRHPTNSIEARKEQLCISSKESHWLSSITNRSSSMVSFRSLPNWTSATPAICFWTRKAGPKSCSSCCCCYQFSKNPQGFLNTQRSAANLCIHNHAHIPYRSTDSDF